MNSPASPSLEVRNPVKTFGDRRVVNGVSFELRRGEIFGLLGPNGSGVTTTMRMALDLIRPDSGSVALLGGMPNRRALKRVGCLHEERGLFQRSQVIDVLRYLGRLKGLEAKAAELRAQEMLKRVGPCRQRAREGPGPLAWTDSTHPVLWRPAPPSRPDNTG